MNPPTLNTALYPSLLWYQGRFQPDMGILFNEHQIEEVRPAQELRQSVEEARAQGRYITTRRLADRAVLPGMVNTHSHAFQRSIRGRTEYPGAQAGGPEDFWSWRGLMYQAALHLSPQDVEAVSQAVFVEMVKAGITRVGEFHYLHHQPDGKLYPEPDELTHRVLSAARSAGIKTTLLRSYYQRAGVGRPHPEGAQRIFCDPSLDFYLETLERLQQAGVEVGVTPHSIRAVARPELERLAEYARRHGLPFHLHANEQEKEIEESLQEYGKRPIELLDEIGALGPATTLVHAIHLNQNEIALLGHHRCFIASCPTTERNLGDGIVPADELRKAGARLTFGTDSQCQIAPWEDARQLEYHLRLRDKLRSLLFSEAEEAGRAYLEMLTVEGALALGQQTCGRLQSGYASDLIAVNLEHLSLAGCTASSLPLDLVFSGQPSAVSDVWVAGSEVVTEGYHRAEKQAQTNLGRVLKKLRAL